MKKLTTLLVGGAFLLSLHGAGVAQQQEKATPAAPAMGAPAAQPEAAAKPAKVEKKAKKKKAARTTKAKKKARTKKAAPVEQKAE